MYFIVGATGSLGGSVAKEFLKRGERVRALVREQSPLRGMGRYTAPEELEQLGAEIVRGDLLEPETIEPHMDGVKAVLTTASGTKRAPPDTIQAVDLHGTEALARLAAGAGVQHLVYVSARGAAPDAPPFLRIKWDAEQAALKNGPPATFVRPAAYMQDWIAFVYGAQLQGGTRVQVVGSSDPRKAYVDEADVVKVLTRLLLAGPPEGERTRVVEVSADSVRASEVVEKMAAATGMPLALDRVPVGTPVSTVPEPIATSITQLLTMMADQPDDPYVTDDAEESYGFGFRTVDEFVSQVFGSRPTEGAATP